MSAVDVTIGDETFYSLNDWSVLGDSTPLIAGDMTGGAGTVSFQLPETLTSKYLQGRPCTLKDAEMGETTGFLRLGGGNGVNATITGYSNIAKLNVSRTVPPANSTLRAYLLYLLGLCGVTTNIAIADTLASKSVRYIGWEGNVLDHLKDLCMVHDMELALIGDTYVFRPACRTIISTRSFADWTWTSSENQLTQNVEVAWYNTSAPASQLIYPAGGWREDVEVFQVAAGEVATYEIDLKPEDGDESSIGMSALTVQQPVCVGSVDRGHNSSSVYSVSGKDSLPIKPAQWAAGGGSLTVEMLDAGSKLRVTITGSSESEYGPYQISMPADSDDYSSLRIYGVGLRYKRGTLRMQTGLDADRASQESTPIVDTPFLNNYEQAWRAASGMLSQHSSATYTIQGTLGQIEVLQHTPTAYFGGTEVEGNPEQHVFGNLEGSLFVAEGLVYRIRSVTYTPAGGTFTAEQCMDGAAQAYALEQVTGSATMTAAQWNAFHANGLTAGEYSSDPLKGHTL